jgi:16S rRNA (uracil1498-N3)-methyltransferase
LSEGVVTLSGPEARHLAGVLRVAPGQRVRAFDGRGLEAEGEVQVADALRVTVRLAAPTKSETEAELAVTLAVALLKGDKLSQVVRQATELGVARFRPFTSHHGDVPSLSANKLERLRRVAKEAAKQSGRSVVPPVEPPTPLVTLPLDFPVLVAHPQAILTLQDAPDFTSVTVVTGPEGGLSGEEVAALQGRGALAVRLGARILRAETAPVALVAALLLPEAL